MKGANKKRETIPWKVKDIIAGVESGQIGLDTEYQREIIWPREKRSLLIDSILNDIDIPKIYLAFFTDDQHYECIDGKQRIGSIIDFYNNLIKTPKIEPETPISDKYFKELKDERLFLDYEFSISTINNPIDDDISTLFFRLNLGDALNGGEKIHARIGSDMRNFIFTTIGENGPFIGKVGMKSYRFSREIALAQIIINSIYFRKDDLFVRARYEDLLKFVDENKKCTKEVAKKTEKIRQRLTEIEKIFGADISKLKRKSAIVSAYLFCEELLEKGDEKHISEFPKFYIKLLDEMKEQADMIKEYKPPKKKILLEKFQKNLQQASVEGYSIERRHEFIKTAFNYYLKTGEIIGDK